MTRVDPSSISMVVRAHLRYRAITEENSGFFAPCAYHASGGRQGREKLHCTMTSGELDEATETPRNEKGNATFARGGINVDSSHRRNRDNIEDRVALARLRVNCCSRTVERVANNAERGFYVAMTGAKLRSWRDPL